MNMRVGGIQSVTASTIQNRYDNTQHYNWLATVSCDDFQTKLEYFRRPNTGQIIKDVKRKHSFEDLDSVHLCIKITKIDRTSFNQTRLYECDLNT